MAQLQIVYLLRPGTQEQWRRLFQEVAESRKEQFEASCQHMGITQLQVRLVQLLHGDLMLVTLHTLEPHQTVQELATAERPLERWLRAQLQGLLGWNVQDLLSGLPDPPGDLIFTWGPPLRKSTENMPVIPKNYADLLETRAFAHVATIGPKGEPQSTPVWFGWDGNHVLLTMTKTAQKYLNLQRDPRLALSIVDPKNSYRYLEIRGDVVGIEEDLGRHFVNSMAKKYLDQDVYPWHRPGDEHVVVIVEPERTTSMG